MYKWIGKIIVFVSSCFAFVFADEVWNDISVFRVNKEEPHAFFLIADKQAEAGKKMSIDAIEKIYLGEAYKSLNGTWKFFFANSRADIKEEFFAKNFNDKKWSDIKVPGTWQMQGWDRIHYANINAEFFYDLKGNWLEEFKGLDSDTAPSATQKPFVPEIHRQAGIYRTEFELKKTWSDKEIFLRFDGVKSGFKLYVNGKYVGYSEDSFTPAEFNVTKYLSDGKNTVALEVYKFTTGSYLEVQDMPHTYGIFRDVTVVARPKIYLEDYYAKTVLADDLKSAKIDLSVKLRNLSSDSTDSANIHVKIVDEKGRTVKGSEYVNGLIKRLPKGEIFTFSKELDVSDFELWSPDKPNLYTIVFSVFEGSKLQETVYADFAFRKLDIANKELRLNNLPLLLKGVNRHDFSPQMGSTVAFDLLKKDMLLIKQANINAIRTSHYPNSDRFYMLANRLGITVLDEANHETHGLRKYVPAENPIYVEISKDRMRNMVMRDRNVPSVIMFSLGNESATYYTLSHKEMEKLGRQLDSTRFIHCEQGAGQASNTSDFVSPMYGGYGRMKWYLEQKYDKPFFFCEYAFVHGLGIGNLEGKWELIRKEPSLSGGYIWDWADRTLYLPNPSNPAENFLADGRDFGTSPSAGTWCSSGLVLGDRTLTPDYFEVQAVYADIQMKEISAGKIQITNEFNSTNLSEFDAEIVLEHNGKVLGKKALQSFNLKPSESKEFDIPLSNFDTKNAGEYFYKINFLSKNNSDFSEKGSVVASKQFFFKKVDYVAKVNFNDVLKNSKEDGKIVLLGKDIKASFDPVLGELCALSFSNVSFLRTPVKFDIQSAWTHNQGQFEREMKNFGAGKLKEELNSFKVEKIDERNARVICSKYYTNEDGEGFLVDIAYTISAQCGAVFADVRIAKINDTPKELLLPRLGLKWGTFAEAKNISYFGRGPRVNFNDELAAANVGLYNLDLSKELLPYSKPQDTGNREDVRWMSVLDAQKRGAIVAAKDKLSMSLMPYEQQQILQAMHFKDMPKEYSPEFRIAGAVAGIGNGSLDDLTEKEYRINFEGSIEFNFAIMQALLPNIDSFKQATVKNPHPYKFEKLDKNLRVEKYLNMPEGKCITDASTKVTYSTRSSQYAPQRDTLLECQDVNYAFHTEKQDNQYLIVDFEKERELSGAILYNRKDAQSDRNDRLRIYISSDGNAWQKLSEINKAKDTWIVNFGGFKKARYLKIELQKHEYFHLRGLKVFGK